MFTNQQNLALMAVILASLSFPSANAGGVAQTAAKAAMARTVVTKEAAKDAAKVPLQKSVAGNLARTGAANQAKHGLRSVVSSQRPTIVMSKVKPLSTTSAARKARLDAVKAGRPAQIVVSRTRYPESAAHIREAQRLGQPSVLTLDRNGAAARRKESLRYVPRRPDFPISGRDRDEYPFAMTREGGFNSSVRYIKAADNRGSGKSIERQVKDLPDGSRVRVLIGE